ncbi:sulfide/dihydroorotate dehydrogenase-like FAD/NAD-binding protein [bacterium]|nr:sulfide/dihydroorotate dehydrogenase-like FAD/NAD-binding protein [bacterium]MBU1636919.1 sulfide/dihydroorotate dehydrogenase-like FAD/NAD-binding protein [bacterium]MBU1920222.1 sulfide/dihydroorotate dehydrogenase-like FAD/NAD-binding protein [bacterium]
MSEFKIHECNLLAENIHEYWVEAPLIAVKHHAGQFVIVRSHDHGERIPLTVVGTDKERGLIRLIVQAAGKSTIEMAELKAGDHFIDVVGPLGMATHIHNWGTMIAIAGGLGAAPLLPIIKAAKEAGNEVCGIIGARSKNLMILEDEFRDICDELRICTDDGTYGDKGLVTDELQKWHDEGKHFDQAIIVGPIMMMKFTALLTKKLEIPAMASLNPIMVDGTGMCGACRVTVHGETKFACVDGPEFDAHGVDFDELNLRNQAYRKQEKKAVEAWEAHRCNIGLTKGAN